MHVFSVNQTSGIKCMNQSTNFNSSNLHCTVILCIFFLPIMDLRTQNSELFIDKIDIGN